MQTSKPKTGSPLQSTRQMLDELDSLMERMLALPVGDADDLPPLPRDVPIAHPVSATVTRTRSSVLPAPDEELAGERSFLTVKTPMHAAVPGKRVDRSAAVESLPG